MPRLSKQARIDRAIRELAKTIVPGVPGVAVSYTIHFSGPMEDNVNPKPKPEPVCPEHGQGGGYCDIPGCGWTANSHEGD